MEHRICNGRRMLRLHCQAHRWAIILGGVRHGGYSRQINDLSLSRHRCLSRSAMDTRRASLMVVELLLLPMGMAVCAVISQQSSIVAVAWPAAAVAVAVGRRRTQSGNGAGIERGQQQRGQLEEEALLLLLPQAAAARVACTWLADRSHPVQLRQRQSDRLLKE